VKLLGYVSISTIFKNSIGHRVWDIERNSNDIRDMRFGMGMGELRFSEPASRDWLLQISAFANELLTMLGKAGESLRMDRHAKV